MAMSINPLVPSAPLSYSTTSASSSSGQRLVCSINPGRSPEKISITNNKRLVPAVRDMTPSGPSQGSYKDSSTAGDGKNSPLRPPPPSGGGGFPLPNIPGWAMWALASIACLAIPFYKRVHKIEGVAEKVAKTVVEEVEKVAPVVEKVAKDIADELPKGSTVELELEIVEHLAEMAEKDAKKVEAFIDKVHEVKEDVEKAIDQASKQGKFIEEKDK